MSDKVEVKIWVSCKCYLIFRSSEYPLVLFDVDICGHKPFV
jgi:hypothetical protein